jgi:hypothetical protein
MGPRRFERLWLFVSGYNVILTVGYSGMCINGVEGNLNKQLTAAFNVVDKQAPIKSNKRTIQAFKH